MNSSDPLLSCALAYKNLLDVTYVFTLGKKGKLVTVELSFEKVHFHHLAGLHKLKDIAFLRSGQREKIFDGILAKKITYDVIAKSGNIAEADKRLASLSKLEQLLDSKKLVFRFLEKNFPFSKIQCTYLIQSSYANSIFYIFLDSKTGNKYFCRSLFEKEKTDYTKNQPKWTIINVIKKTR